MFFSQTYVNTPHQLVRPCDGFSSGWQYITIVEKVVPRLHVEVVPRWQRCHYRRPWLPPAIVEEPLTNVFHLGIVDLGAIANEL